MDIRHRETSYASASADGCDVPRPYGIAVVLAMLAFAILMALAALPARALAADVDVSSEADSASNLLLETLASAWEADDPELSTADDDIASGDCGDCDWVIDSEGVLTISPSDGKSGELDSFRTYRNPPWYSYRSYVTKIVIEEGVTAGTRADYMFYKMENLTEVTGPGASGLITDDVSYLRYMFYGCSSLESVDLSGWDVSAVFYTDYMFYGCSSLEALDVSGWDFYQSWGYATLGSCSYMFYGCSSLETLDVSNWNLENVSDSCYMFYGCSSLEALDVSGWGISDNVYMESMFRGCSSLTMLDLSGWDVSNVRYMTYMFYGCSSLEAIGDVSRWDTSSMSSSGFEYMFYGCSSLEYVDVSGWDISGSSNDSISRMFYGCSSLTMLDLSGWDASDIDSAAYAFYGCSSLETVGDLSGWDVSSLTSMRYMFRGCSSLASLDLSGWDVSAAAADDSGSTAMDGIFEGCSSLKSLTLGSGWAFLDPDGCGLPTPEGDGYTGYWACYSDDGSLIYDVYTASGLVDAWSVTAMPGKWVWQPENGSVPIPTAIEGLVYDGTEQVGVEGGAGPYTVTGNSAVSVGTYTATASLADKESCTWEDGTTDDKTIEWSIAVLDFSNVKVVTIEDELTYTGEAIEPEIAVTTISGTVIPTSCYDCMFSDNVDVGTAKVTVYAKGDDCTGTATGEFEIEQLLLDIPEGKVLPYTGYEQSGIDDSPYYTVTGGTATEVGEYTATLSLVNSDNAKWTRSTKDQDVEWSIVVNEDPELTVSANDLTYNGQAQDPEVVIALEDGTVIDPSEYELAYYDSEGNLLDGLPVDAGDYTAVAVADGGFVFETSVEFTISAIDISGATVVIESESSAYTGEAIVPAVTATLEDGTVLSEGTDYSVSYADAEGNAVEMPTDAGTYAVTVVGVGNYAGTAIATFAIDPYEVDVPVAVKGLVYDGTEQMGVAADGDGLYAVEDGSATDAGSYTATLSLADKGNYVWVSTGASDDVEVEWSIAAADLSGATVVIDPAEYVYTGEAVVPAVTVTLEDGTVLSEGTDYTVSYADSDGNAVESPIEEGTYNVTVTGSGNYAGSVTVTFAIVEASDGSGGDGDTGNGSEDGDSGDDGSGGEDDDSTGTTSSVTITRLHGETRYETMQAIVAEAFDGETSEYAVVATGDGYADALAASSLAGALDAPIVLVNGENVDAAISAIQAVGATEVYIIGGETAVSDVTVAAIDAADGVDIVEPVSADDGSDATNESAGSGAYDGRRLAGDDRYGTAEAIAAETAAIMGDGASTTAIVATGTGFADALSASAYAYWTASPIYLAGDDGEVSESALVAIEAAGYDEIVVVGGRSVVSETCYETLDSVADATRVYGLDRYATSAEMAIWSVAEGMAYDGCAIATGSNFPDALAGAALCGRSGSVLLLVSDEGGPAVDLLSTNLDGVGGVFILGGTSAVTEDACSSVQGVFEAAGIEVTYVGDEWDRFENNDGTDGGTSTGDASGSTGSESESAGSAEASR